ncbi:hypothetical protein P261_01818 [Lachnospiraceae bacterium TWA4]|nr:hypothetical protein P261_01818 [Lachnospiraceae bacterium TWA4]
MILLTAVIEIKVNAQQSGELGDNLKWELDDKGTLKISGEGSMEDLDIGLSPLPKKR